MEFVEPPEHGVEVMIDLETMGTEPYSPVIAIGAVRFEAGPMQPMPPFYAAITLESCMKVGLRPSADTIKWWMKQKPEAQAVLDDPEAMPIHDALDAFTAWWGDRPDRPWGNSAAFDLGLLAAAYKACGLTAPWKFYNERCYRTLKGLPGMDRFKLERMGTHHNALDDAATQMHHCRAMLAALNGLSVAPAIGLARVKPEGGLSLPPGGVVDIDARTPVQHPAPDVGSEWGDVPL
jgi:hypothetical protein